MNIQTRFFLLFGILTILFGSALTAPPFHERTAYEALRENAQQERVARSHNALEIRGYNLAASPKPERHTAWVLQIVIPSPVLVRQNALASPGVAAALFLIALLGLLAFCLRQWVLLPLQAIVRALQTGEDVPQRFGVLALTTEFQELSRLVHDSHHQRKELEEHKRELGRVQEALRRQRTFFRNILDAAPNLILVETANGTFSFVNQSVADEFGTTVDALVGRTVA